MDRAVAVVAFGGGHGLHASLSALRLLVDELVVDDLTAVVTVADNGGSSGRLRGEFGVLPPGDLRMALAALCGRNEWGVTWSRVLQHRFAGRGRDARPRGRQPAHRRALGAARRPRRRARLRRPAARRHRPGAADGAGRRWTSPRRCAAWCPATPTRWSAVRGQVEVATTDGIIDSIALVPPDPPAAPEALKAIEAADWVVLGPGSWFTSVIPHLMVPALRQALVSTDARVVVVLNLVGEAGETPGFGPADHLRGARRARPRPARPHRAGRRAPGAGRSSTSSRTWSRRTARGWSSTTSPRRPGRPATTPSSWPRRTPGSSSGSG